MMPQAATAEHRGDGVDRRNEHHQRLARERSEREAGMRAFEPPPDEEGAVEHLSASVVLAAVEESGPNYLLPKAPEPVKSRRKRLMVDEAARQAGQVILETGTRVEIFAEDSEEERWWPATIMERTTCVTRNPECHSRSIKCRICSAFCCKQVCKWLF